MAKGCDCTIGWVTDPDAVGTAEMVPIRCGEYRAVLWKLTMMGVQNLTPREARIHRAALDNQWR